jgi:CHASE2 domain-containing sensor protein
MTIMARRKKQKKKKHPRTPAAPHASDAAPVLRPAEERRAHRIRLDVQKSVLLSALIIACMIGIEHTRLGERIERVGYEVLQGRLSNAKMPVMAVTVVDTSGILTHPEAPTSRETIRQALEAIGGQRPKAIGVDIDYSPDELGYQFPHDPEFFNACLDIEKRTGVPIFLGVGRSVLKPASQWLGDAKYQSLAANILIPIDSMQMVHTLESVPSMSAALAAAYRARPPYSRPTSAIESLKRWGLLENISTKTLTSGLSLREFWVDYSPLALLRETAVLTTDPQYLAHEASRRNFEDRVVIFGDLRAQIPDRFSVRGEEQPGVLLHACATNTQITGPLYVVTPRGRQHIDVACVLVVLASITLIRWMYERRTPVHVAVGRLQVLLTTFLLLAPFMAGVAFVRTTRILWNDFILTASALLLHPSLEHHIAAFWTKVCEAVRRVSVLVAFQSREETG